MRQFHLSPPRGRNHTPQFYEGLRQVFQSPLRRDAPEVFQIFLLLAQQWSPNLGQYLRRLKPDNLIGVCLTDNRPLTSPLVDWVRRAFPGQCSTARRLDQCLSLYYQDDENHNNYGNGIETPIQRLLFLFYSRTRFKYTATIVATVPR